MKSYKTHAENVFLTIDENFNYIKENLGYSSGLIKNTYEIFGGKIKLGIAYIESIADTQLISQHILAPLLFGNVVSDISPDDIFVLMQRRYISVPKTSNINSMDQIIKGLINGDTILFLNGASTALDIGSRMLENPSINSPDNEVTVLGSQESFTDNLETNTSLILKRLPIPGLRFESNIAGRLSRTIIVTIWLEDIANPRIIEEVNTRIKKIDIDNVGGLGVLAELIEDNPLSIFPKYRITERPDVVARNIADGHFAILCSNSPFALIAPSSFWDNFKTMDDYEETPLTSSYLRIVRYIAFIISVLISPLYLAFVTYNHAIVPPALAFNIAAGREGVPFPTVVEMLLMSLAMTIIREAGLRMPGAVGYFIGTLAAVLIGQAVVNAGYVSASLIIVIAMSAISSFSISTTNLIYTSRLLNYFFILLSGFLGMFGLINGIAIVFWHMVSLRSFGVPYLYPVVPFDFEGLKDTFIRVPFRFLKKCSGMLSPSNTVRVGDKGIESKEKKRGGE